MKKLTILLAAAAIISGSAQAKTDFKPTNTADSAGYYIGYTQGTIMGQNINTSPDIADDERDLYRSEFLRGVTQALLADTVQTGYMDGLKMGAAMRDELIKLRNQGLPCNLELFNTAFAGQVNAPDTASLNSNMLIVQALIYYTGTLVDGSQFDATEPGHPVRLGPENVIPGFAEALMLMNKGAHYVFYIPQELAYGMQGPPVIGPAQTLVFDIDVVELIPE